MAASSSVSLPKKVVIQPRPLRFPKNFVWGTATAAPQIEGAGDLDGKGPSVWDTMAHRGGKILNNDTLDVACDHYHRYRQDFALMAKLGMRHYRFSLAWPRIIPAGTGAINQKGLDFYSRLIDAMLAKGITPWVTMFHWDLPQPLEDADGWRGRAVVDAFARYADTIVSAYADRVKNWITLNEIICFTEMSYGTGGNPPGVKEGPAVVNQTYHHAILCHGHGVRAVREHGGRGARVGLTDNSIVSIPVTETPEDIAAAQANFIAENTRILEPIYRGRYRDDYRRQAGRAFPKVGRGDMELISLPTDFLGLNIYSGNFVRAGKNNRPERLAHPKGYPTSDSPWLKLAPQALYWGPRFATEIYSIPNIYITENGAGYDDLPPENGEVLDLHRREYVRNCLRELHRGIADGVPVRGYFLWSFMDNFEWLDGYTRRFGIVYNDFKTQKRTPKLSALWYSRVMSENALV